MRYTTGKSNNALIGQWQNQTDSSLHWSLCLSFSCVSFPCICEHWALLHIRWCNLETNRWKNKHWLFWNSLAENKSDSCCTWQHQCVGLCLTVFVDRALPPFLCVGMPTFTNKYSTVNFIIKVKIFFFPTPIKIHPVGGVDVWSKCHCSLCGSFEGMPLIKNNHLNQFLA